MSKYVITAAEIAEIMEVSKRTGYFIIKRLNCELTEKGYMTQAGRVSRKYFYERFG
ncbi:DNA-binding protein [Lachnospiraceae bacterium 54-53]